MSNSINALTDKQRNHHFFFRLFLIVALILFVTFLHYFTGTEHSQNHGIYRRLYYVPIILSGFWFGIRGGLISSLIVSAIYTPHILIQWEHNGPIRLEQTLEIVLYNIIGLLTGFLASQINFQRRRAEDNMQKLLDSYAKLREQADMIVTIEDQLRQADRLSALGELSAGLAHEIRNPLGSIRGTAEILKDLPPGDNRHDEFSGILINEVCRLNQVVEGFLQVARPESTKQSEFNLEELLNEVTQLTRPQANKSKIRIHRDIDSLPAVIGNVTQFKQVFLNLILNAMQAIGEDGDLWISSISGEKGDVFLSFRDSGPGIDEAHFKQIFDPFFTTKADGTGLGLAITCRIIQSFGGKIQVRNSEQGGAEFILQLKSA
jgi:two-component system, NtrC family, sensor histidine kinase HydH